MSIRLYICMFSPTYVHLLVTSFWGWLNAPQRRAQAIGRLIQAAQRPGQAGSGLSKANSNQLETSWGYGTGPANSGWMDRWTDGQRDTWMFGHTDRISPYVLQSTGHHPLLIPLPCLHLALAPQLMAGQGYCWTPDAFGRLVFCSLSEGEIYQIRPEGVSKHFTELVWGPS